jgi:hypothetical protein
VARLSPGALALVASLFASPTLEALENTAEIYGKGRRVDSLVISPDGTRIAFLSTRDGVNGLVIKPVTGEGGFRIPSPDLKLRSVEWSGPNHVLLYASETEINRAFAIPLIEFWGVFSIDVRSREIVQLLSRNRTMDLQSSLANVRAKTWDENGTVYMAACTRAGGKRYSESAVNQICGKGA